MSKSTTPVKEENKKESKKEQVTQQANIAQQDPNAEDTQAHIKENARKGEPVFVPNVIGPDAITTPLDSGK